MSADKQELRELLHEYLTVMRALRQHGIASVADIAEYAFEQALGGKRVARGQKGYDILVPDLGRVQVKARSLPDDGRPGRTATPAQPAMPTATPPSG